MRQAPCSFGLPDEALAILALLFRRLAGQGNGFHRDHAVDLRIARLVDNTHGSPSQLLKDLVSPKTFALGIIHSCHLRFQSFVATSEGAAAFAWSSDAVVTSTPTTFSFNTSRSFFACARVIPFSSSKLT